MTEDSSPWGRATGLVNRRSEREALDRLIEAVQVGQSKALVVRGDPGVGKTVLLDYLAARASGSGCRVARVAGVQSEMELAFAGLHQLCAPMLTRADDLPVPQHEALRVALGLTTGPPPDRFLVGLAVLGLLSEVSGDRPLVCVIDDQQWLDRGSAQALGFVARRLGADPVALVFAARVPGAELAGLAELELDGLNERDAHALLDSTLTRPLDARVRDLIVAETQGNPLALLELPRGLTSAEMAGGFGLPDAVSLPGRIEDSFTRQLEVLPDQTRRLLLLAAADPSGDRSLVWRAARRLGIPVGAGTPAVEAGLVHFGAPVRFCHPLARSAAYSLASVAEMQEAHGALAKVTDPATDPDRLAWHRAQAAPGPDEDVAVDLENSAGRAQARGGLAAAAAFLERAVLLTADPARRPERALAAAQANLQAGAFSNALELLVTAEGGSLDEFQEARVALLRGQIAFASGLGSDAPPLLLQAARRLEPLNLELARETYLGAWMAAMFAGCLAGPVDLPEVCRAARALPPLADLPRPIDLILDGLAQFVIDGPAAAAQRLRHAARAFADADMTVEEGLRWGWLAHAAASATWDDEVWRVLLEQHARLAREVGALDQLPVILGALSMSYTWSGDFTAAASLITESNTICEATGSRVAPYAAMMLASFRGHQTEAIPLIEATITEATAGGQGLAVTYARWTAAILYNGLGRYDEALTAAGQAEEDVFYVSMWALPELIEAASRSGNTDMANDALARFTQIAQASGTDFALGIEARSRALLSPSQAAEALYREAIERLGRAQLRPELARAHLLYGEWLRREKLRTQARAELRTAHEMLDAMGMAAFAERARRELQATGERIGRRPAEAPGMLTAQELHIARLARDGRTNPEIGAQLFLSARTVEWHLRNVFTKLGIGSRRELRAALALLDQDRQPA
jgi:DNA-binding CsgD family transcriptional regulator